MKSLFEQQSDDLTKEHPPLCVDCHWIAKSNREEFEKHSCMNPNNYSGINLIDGGIVLKQRHCIYHRTTNNPNLCGIEGRWFELRKEPIITKTEISNITPPERFKLLKSTKLTAEKLENL